jgi:hypothetical protein
MPHFNDAGEDVVLCQVCWGVTTKPVWRCDITGTKSAGCVCPECLKKYENRTVSLYDHCKQESGLEGAALVKYINRHYGHG